MKTIIAGCRDVDDFGIVDAALTEFYYQHGCPTEVVSGAAMGADMLGERWAKLHFIPVARFPANWDEHGKAAGPIRNRQMAEYADALVAVWDGKSKGTKNMIDEATKRGLVVHIHRI